jgi:hypothetical protein
MSLRNGRRNLAQGGVSVANETPRLGLMIFVARFSFLRKRS